MQPHSTTVETKDKPFDFVAAFSLDVNYQIAVDDLLLFS